MSAALHFREIHARLHYDKRIMKSRYFAGGWAESARMAGTGSRQTGSAGYSEDNIGVPFPVSPSCIVTGGETLRSIRST